MPRRSTVSKKRSMFGGAANNVGPDIVGEINCESEESGLNLMLCQLRVRLLQICQCMVDIVNLNNHNQKIQRICLSEGVVLKRDTRPLEKRIKDAYDMLKGLVDKLPGDQNNFDDPNFLTRAQFSSLTTTYEHFKELIAKMKPIMVTEYPIYSDEYAHFLKLTKEVVNKLHTTFREAMSEEQVQSRQLSKEAAQFHNFERESLMSMKHILNSKPWHKAEQQVSSMRSNLEKRRSELPSGRPPPPPGAPAIAGLMGEVVTPPRVVAAPPPPPANSSWAVATPKREGRVLVPAGGRKTLRRRRY